MYRFHDRESFVTIDLIDETENHVLCAVTKDGRISVIEYDKLVDEDGIYFNYEYGVESQKIYLADFE